MKNKEFKKFIIEVASKYLKEDNEEVNSINQQSKKKQKNEITENITPDDIKILAEQMKKINKKIDLRKPLIDKSFFEKIKEKKENLSENKRWKDMCNYTIPEDDNR